MKREIVLWKNQKGLDSAINEVICLTFITAQHRIWTLVPLMIQTYYRTKKLFPRVKLYSLKQYRNDEWKLGKIVENMPGFELTMSLIRPLELKRICMALELNSRGERVCDIDVRVFYRKEKRLCKVSRYIFEELIT